MNFFGIGTLELLVIFLVAFVALGPGKTVEVARTIGRMAREARRTFTEIMDAANPIDPTPNRRDPESAPRNTVPPDDPISSPAPPCGANSDAFRRRRPIDILNAPSSRR